MAVQGLVAGERLAGEAGLVTGLVVDDSGFEVLAGERRIGPRRLIEPGDVELLNELARRYVRAVQAGSRPEEFIAIGRDLFTWLDGDSGQLSQLLEGAAPPLVFEVQGRRVPSEQAWAVLRAPFELLALPVGGSPVESASGFLAEDALLRFCVVRRLGAPEAPPAPDGFRLGLAFMASSPRGQHELDYEAEEAAILNAVGENRVDLVVDDTGDPEQLAHRLAELGGMPAVHLSCHGVNSYRVRAGQPGVPVLMMEDDAGAGRPTTAADLVGLLTVRPRLLFVSACLTATGANATGQLPPGEKHKTGQAEVQAAASEAKGEPNQAETDDIGSGGLGNKAAAGEDDKAGMRANGSGGLLAHSLATALVVAGIPAVIGWDGSVGDTAATLFAEQMYRGLADRADLAVAVGDARRALLDSDNSYVRDDWHLARLWLGPTGGGALVGGVKRRSMVTATQGTKAFLDRKNRVPVAAAQMFVGRRHELQRALGVLRNRARAGVLLHGQGRLGKSSLAARIADRMTGHALGVVYGDYSALGILDAVSAAVRTNREARELIESRLAEVRQRPEAIEDVLTDLLTGPCAQADDGGERPLLLIIDDLEQILVSNPAGPHRMAPAHAPVLAAVLRAFDPAYTDSRLLVTSRFTFTLDGLESRLVDVQLPPLTDVSQRKLQRRQQSVTPAERRAERSELAERAVAVSRGNPGLQDLIGLRLVYGEHVGMERAEAAVAGMEDYLQRGGLPTEPDVRAFLEVLALDALLDAAGPSNVALLRAATLFDLPVPESVIGALTPKIGGSVPRLRGLGLLDPYVDLYDQGVTALAVNPLVAGRVQPLSDVERRALAVASTDSLFTIWGGTTGSDQRSGVLDLQLTRLGLLANAPEPVAACAAHAIRQLRSGPAADAFHLGREAIELLDRHGHRVSLLLLRQTADAAFISGDAAEGEVMLDRAANQINTEGALGTDSLDRARVVTEQARRLITRGEVERAEGMARQAHKLFAAGGSELEAAAAMGDIADIYYMRGDYNEALRIRQEIELPVYERLGDTRAAAVNWSKIADIYYMRGDYNEALRIQQEITLPAFERLGDTRETALTWSKIADIAYRRGDYEYAAELYHKGLEVNRQIGDLDGTAAIQWKLAQIDLARENHEAAFPRLIEAFDIFSQLRRPDGVTTVGLTLGQSLTMRGAYENARRVFEDALGAARKLEWADTVRKIEELIEALPAPGESNSQ